MLWWTTFIGHNKHKRTKFIPQTLLFLCVQYIDMFKCSSGNVVTIFKKLEVDKWQTVYLHMPFWGYVSQELSRCVCGWGVSSLKSIPRVWRKSGLMLPVITLWTALYHILFIFIGMSVVWMEYICMQYVYGELKCLWITEKK